MPNLDPLTNPLRDLWSRASSSTSSSGGASATATSSSTGPTRPQADIDAAYDHAVEALPDPSIALPAFLARMDPVGTRLDQLQATMQGPYRLNGTTVYSGAQFRMTDGFNQAAVDARGPDHDALVKAASKAGVSLYELQKLQEGRGDPKALTRVTQALIDGGQLDVAPERPLADQIHDLQWRFGLGFDCAGYVYRAVASVHGDPAKLGLKAAVDENFAGLPYNPHFAKMAPADVRAGDILVLEGHGRGDPGHNLVVYSHCTVGSAVAITERYPGAADFLAGKTGVQAYEVDSSFGAGPNGNPQGGVRRDVLLYDPKSDSWCTCKGTVPSIVFDGKTPYSERAVTGFFRPRGTP